MTRCTGSGAESALAESAIVAWAASEAVSACEAFAALVAVTAVAALVALVAFGTWPRLATSIFAPVTAPFLIFAAVIALFLICFVPTEFFGSLTAA
jgi:hypothetical protein